MFPSLRALRSDIDMFFGQREPPLPYLVHQLGRTQQAPI